MAICASQPAITKKAALLWAAGVHDLNATIITGAATRSSEEPGTSTGGITPRVPGPLWDSDTAISLGHPRLSTPHDSAS